MDIKKTVTYILLAIVVFLLWTSWVKEQSKTQAALALQTQRADNDKSGMNIPLMDSEPQSEKAERSSQPIQKEKKGEIVSVKTDLLNLKINTQGGSITYASLTDYPQSLKDKNQPFVLLQNQDNKFYIAESGLLSELGPDFQNQEAIYSTEKNEYSLSDGEKNLIVDLHWKKEGIEAIKRFTFTRGEYLVHVNYLLKNQSEKEWRGNFYTQILQRKSTEKKSGVFDISSYEGASISSDKKAYEKISFREMRKQNLDREIKGGWMAMQQHYFLSSWIPDPNQISRYYTRVLENDLYVIGASAQEKVLKPSEQLSIGAKIYLGPELLDQLEQAAPHLNLTIDYGWLWFISSAIFWLMSKIYDVVGNWGWSIVIVTALIKLAFYKLSVKSYRSMAGMRKLQPKIESIRQRFGDDRQKLNQAIMELYRKEKINPLGGCLPILVQIPVFIALYWVLIESVQLRQAPFIFWIHDLSARDPYFILNLLMGLTMYLQQRLSPQPPDPLQAKVMMALPIVFTLLLLYFPSGLVLYWVVNNTLSIAQQWYITKKLEREPEGKLRKKNK